MSLRAYDEPAIMERLARLGRRDKTAFAASCAQRLLPCFELYVRLRGTPELMRRLEEIVATTWDAAGGSDADIAGLRAEAGAMGPDVEDDGWTREFGYAQNAAAAAAYAVGTWLNNDTQEAAWAARQVYEIADYAVLESNPDMDLNVPGAEREILGTELVQRALAAIDHDLEVVESAPSTWQALRAAAEAGGVAWTGALLRLFPG